MASARDASRQIAVNKVEMEHDFTCPICISMLLEPVSLLCGHRLCKGCALQCDKKGPSNSGRNPFICPVCREVQPVPATDLRVDFFLKGFLESHFRSEYEARKKEAAQTDWVAVQRENESLKEQLMRLQRQQSDSQALMEKLHSMMEKQVQEKDEYQKEIQLLRSKVQDMHVSPPISPSQGYGHPPTGMMMGMMGSPMRSNSMSSINSRPGTSATPHIVVSDITPPMTPLYGNRGSPAPPSAVHSIHRPAQSMAPSAIENEYGIPMGARSMPPSMAAAPAPRREFLREPASPPPPATAQSRSSPSSSSIIPPASAASPSVPISRERERLLEREKERELFERPITRDNLSISRVPSATPSGRKSPTSTKREKYRFFGDDYQTIEEVQEALDDAGLESSNLIIGVDFTKSNLKKGQRTFNGKSLHHISSRERNPYEEVIAILGKTLEPFAESKEIPVFGFGDTTTQDHSVFPFYRDRLATTFEEVVARYREIVPRITLSGPTSFAPLIRAAMDVVKSKGRARYHILVIIADGQVTSMKETINAIVEAAELPLSIVMIGVGDGPWDMMREFDDRLPERAFDNFQFVDFHSEMRKRNPHIALSLAALMELPGQFRACVDLGLLGKM